MFRMEIKSQENTALFGCIIKKTPPILLRLPVVLYLVFENESR